MVYHDGRDELPDICQPHAPAHCRVDGIFHVLLHPQLPCVAGALTHTEGLLGAPYRILPGLPARLLRIGQDPEKNASFVLL